jgi:hypothetical protein
MLLGSVVKFTHLSSGYVIPANFLIERVPEEDGHDDYMFRVVNVGTETPCTGSDEPRYLQATPGGHADLEGRNIPKIRCGRVVLIGCCLIGGWLGVPHQNFLEKLPLLIAPSSFRLPEYLYKNLRSSR